MVQAHCVRVIAATQHKVALIHFGTRSWQGDWRLMESALIAVAVLFVLLIAGVSGALLFVRR
jgi:hypothetical protein